MLVCWGSVKYFLSPVQSCSGGLQQIAVQWAMCCVGGLIVGFTVMTEHKWGRIALKNNFGSFLSRSKFWHGNLKCVVTAFFRPFQFAVVQDYEMHPSSIAVRPFVVNLYNLKFVEIMLIENQFLPHKWTLRLRYESEQGNVAAWPIPVAARSKACVCGRSRAGIVGSNPAWSIDVCLLWMSCVVR